MNPEEFTGLGFVASYWNADPSTISGLGSVSRLGVKVAHGTGPSEQPSGHRLWIDLCNAHGLGVVGWAWCAATDTIGASAEAQAHVEKCAELGLTAFIANPEEPYDAHGDSGSPRFFMCDTYWDSFLFHADRLGLRFDALGQTSTPFFASSATEATEAGVVGMPQCFVGDYAPATIPNCHDHWKAWGWRLVRPLVQVYTTDGVRPPVGPYLTDATRLGLGVAPYLVEQALDPDGRVALNDLKPATFRPTMGEPDMELIGPQHGIKAAISRLKKLDPAGTNPNRDPNNLSTWGAWDKLERTLLILAEDHDKA